MGEWTPAMVEERLDSAADVFRWTRACTGDASRIVDALFAWEPFEAEQVTPVVAEVVFVNDSKWLAIGVVRKNEIDEP